VDEDGYYWHAGRGDDMLKVGGLWVSPLEIENALNEHDAVTECAVVGHYDNAQLLKPKAFVCVQDNVETSNDLLAELLKLYDLPRTATGKVQRFRLREQ